MKRKPLTHLEVVLAASLVITCTPTAEADESSLDFSATGSSGGSTITVIGDQYERLDPAAGSSGAGSSGGSGSGSSGGSSGVVVGVGF